MFQSVVPFLRHLFSVELSLLQMRLENKTTKSLRTNVIRKLQVEIKYKNCIFETELGAEPKALW